MPPTLPPGFWGPSWAAPRHRAVTELVREGVLDAELAALLWLLVEARVPMVVSAGPSGTGKSTLLAALLDLLPASTDIRPVLGPDPDLSWLPEAAALGWQRSRERVPERAGLGPAAPAVESLPLAPDASGSAARPSDPPAPADPARTVLLVPELSGHLPWYAWASLARVVVRAASLGYGLLTTVHGDRLEDILESLGAPPVSLSADELGHLGVVLFVRAIEPAPGEPSARRRVMSAHLIRPPARDAAGHLQRLGPAVLAARDPRRDVLEHYAWGVMPEIAARLGRRAGDLERAQALRAGMFHRLVADHRLDRGALAEAIDAYRSEHRGDPGA